MSGITQAFKHSVCSGMAHDSTEMSFPHYCLQVTPYNLLVSCPDRFFSFCVGAEKKRVYARRISYCRFVNKPLLFITTNQRSPKVVDSAAQKMYWRSTRPFFSPPPHKKKKSGLGTRLTTYRCEHK